MHFAFRLGRFCRGLQRTSNRPRPWGFQEVPTVHPCEPRPPGPCQGSLHMQLFKHGQPGLGHHTYGRARYVLGNRRSSVTSFGAKRSNSQSKVPESLHVQDLKNMQRCSWPSWASGPSSAAARGASKTATGASTSGQSDISLVWMLGSATLNRTRWPW